MPTNTAVQQFIQAQLATGKSIEEIKTALTAQGWDTAVISDSLTAAQSGTPLPSTPTLRQDGKGTSDGMTALTIVLLWLISPVGVIVMWTSTSWSKVVKWIVTIIFLVIPVLAIIGILAAVILVAVDPAAQFRKANIMTAKQDVQQLLSAADRYHALNEKYPASVNDLIEAKELDSSFGTANESNMSYTLQQTDAGADCEITVTELGQTPFVVLCSTMDLTEFDRLIAAESASE